MYEIIFLLFRNIFRSETARLLLRITFWSFGTTKLLNVSNPDNEFFFERTQIRSDAASPITTDGIPLKFVSTGNLTSADRLTFCWSIRNAVQKALRPKSGHGFRNLKGLIAGGFSHCLLPSPHFAIVFFFVLGSAFARLYLLLYKAQKKKHTKKNASYVRGLSVGNYFTPILRYPSFLSLAVIRQSAIAALRVETSRPLEGTLPKLHFSIHVCLQFNCAKIYNAFQ